MKYNDSKCINEGNLLLKNRGKGKLFRSMKGFFQSLTSIYLLRSVNFKMSWFGPKCQRKNLRNSALEFEKWSNYRIKALYNVFNSPYNHM